MLTGSVLEGVEHPVTLMDDNEWGEIIFLK